MADVKVALGTAHLTVLLARQASVGVILRRGPIGWLQVIKWYTDIDVFESGHWLEGEIKDADVDISPDGQLMIYKASKPDDWAKEGYIKDWTAISKPPYLTSLAQWAGSSGGLFLNNTTVLIIDPQSDSPPRLPPEQFKVFYKKTHEFDTIPLYKKTYETEDYIRWDKTEHSQLHYRLVRNFPTSSIEKHVITWTNQASYSFIDRSTHFRYPLPDVTWADIDQQGRWVYAKDGKLFTATGQDGRLISTELADFNGRKPERVRTPKWAKEW